MMKSEPWITKRRGSFSLWRLMALVAMLGWGVAALPAAWGEQPGVLRLIKTHPDWTYGRSATAPYTFWDSTPNTLWSLNDALLFWAYDRQHGMELWRSDGTTSGTALLKDLHPGIPDSYPGYSVRYHDYYIFLLDNGQSLWRTDGTTSGTVLLKEFPSYSSTYVRYSQFVEYKGQIYFCHSGDGSYPTLWRTDGTVSGTVSVTTVTAWEGVRFFEYDGLLYIYHASLSLAGWLNCTDGTAAGTRNLGVRLGPQVINANGTLIYFRRDNVKNEFVLCRSDAPTTSETTLKAGFSGVGSEFHRLSPTDKTVFFAADDGVHGQELWKTDGTAAGTQLVCDLQPGAASSNVASLFVMNGKLFFATSQGGGYGVALWQTDGAAGGTQLVREFHPKPAASSLGLPSDLTDVNGVLYFSADDGDGYAHLWRSDGTPGGTTQIPSAPPDMAYTPRGLAVVGDRLFLSAPYIPDLPYTGSGGLWGMDLAKPNAVGHWRNYR